MAKLRGVNNRCGGSEEAGGGSVADLKQDLAEAEQRVAGHDQLAIECVKVHEKLRANLKQRFAFWKRSLKVCESNSTNEFDRCLSHRGLAGRLLYDHDKEELGVEVSTSSQDANAHASRSLRTLSGGEQAFSTLAFSLAMWPFSASPLRAMDEFDKNMDDTYLQASLQLLLEAAEASPTRQMLILTPNDYHGCLTGEVCKGAYDALQAQGTDRSVNEGGIGRPVEILRLANVDRS